MNRRPLILAAAVAALMLAVLPPALDLTGAWGAVHRIGGTLAIAMLAWAAWRVGGAVRWTAAATVIVSVATIAWISSGESVPVVLQWLLLIALGGNFLFSVWRATRV
jgi:hypothetical protein